MPALFPHEMVLAAVDPFRSLRKDGSSYWSVHYFDRMGRWTASATGMSKADAKKKAAKGRRMARREIAKKDSTRLTAEPVDSGSSDSAPIDSDGERS